MTSAKSLGMKKLLTTLVLVGAAACGKTDPSAGSATTTTSVGGGIIKADGSSTVFPISEAVAEEFGKANKSAKVTVGISGTGGGFKKFCGGEIDISDASRPIKPTEVELCTKNGVEFIEIPIAYDGLALMVHPKNTWVTSLKVSELKMIWEPEAQGKVMKWNQINPAWPDKELHLFGPGTDSGTFDYFTETITKKEKASRGDYTSSEDDNTLVQGIAGDEGALGYFGFAYYAENKDKLKLVPIDDEKPENGAEPVLPSAESIRTGTYTPLSRPIFIYVSKKSLERPEVAAFVDFYLKEGPALVQEVGYVPLPDTAYTLVQARVSSKKLGTMFAPGANPALTIEQRLAAKE
jgi:phosphate transport system substrate-binding protein